LILKVRISIRNARAIEQEDEQTRNRRSYHNSEPTRTSRRHMIIPIYRWRRKLPYDRLRRFSMFPGSIYDVEFMLIFIY